MTFFSWHFFAIAVSSTLINLVASRAVNISNTWMLPEESFPVFYRYFRDRISWYEADAVCQFHHANLVTADTSSQYDAIRAYLKELDISDNVWIGLSKSSEKSMFTWADSTPMNGEGHWHETIPVGSDSLCVTMDPAADFLWKPLPCGGPEVASFICELPVPSWALGPNGCLLTELPSLTALYIPEQMAIELTSDCGLDGTRRITCKGEADREQILQQLSCILPNDSFEDKILTKSFYEESSSPDDVSSSSSDEGFLNSKTTKPWIWTSNTIDIDYGMPTRHRRETEDTLSPSITKVTTDISSMEAETQTEAQILSTSSPPPMELRKESDSTSLEITTNRPSNENVTTPDVSRTTHRGASYIPERPSATQVDASPSTVVIQDINSASHVANTGTATAESKTSAAPASPSDAFQEDIAEYPSAINQGQLFSIIENGTMFDIIELNETSIDDLKSSTSKIPNETTILSISSTTVVSLTIKSLSTKGDNSYTTVVYPKEAPSDVAQVTNKISKKLDKINKIQVYKKSDPKKANYPKDKELTKTKIENIVETKETNGNLSKEMEMYPLVGGSSLVKLNRTNRKELPNLEMMEDGLDEEKKTKISLDTKTNFLDTLEDASHERLHENVEIHLGENLTAPTLFITTKRSETRTTTLTPISGLKFKSGPTVETLIDPKLDELNRNVTENNESESFIPSKTKKIDIYPADEEKQFPASFLNNSDEGHLEIKSHNANTQGPLEQEPITQARPNRQRQLTRPQRRSFYPYFFSRVLG